MANLIVEHPTRAAGEALDGTLSVGRGSDNDIVLDHPTVSRHHSVIERIAGEYFLTDLGSRNGTRANGRTVRGRKPIAHGDKIRFGQVRVTFLVSSQDPDAAPTLERMPTPEAPDPGILFDCLCGTRLWAKTEAAGGIVQCGKCKRDNVVPERSTNKDNSETVSGMILSRIDEPEMLAAPVQMGTCSICQWHTTNEDRIKVCPSCGLTFHDDCWRENCGCSAYGCPEVNAHAPKRPPRPDLPEELAREAIVIDADPQERPAIPAPESRRVNPSDKMPLAHAMLGASLVGTVLGLMAFGVFALAVLVVCLYILNRKVTRRRPERKLMFAAAAIAVTGTIAGVAVSSAWWLGVKL